MQFCSNSSYLNLPSKRNPKVALVIDNPEICKNSLKLYNPFSKKAKLLKIITTFFSIHFNPLVRIFFSEKSNHTSFFIQQLEKEMGEKLHASIYYATAKDKVVLQLQTKNHQKLGYVKLAINEIGEKHVNKELQAIKILGEKGLIDMDYLIQKGKYKDLSYCFLKELQGTIGSVSKESVLTILDTLKTEKSYTLSKHPRILGIRFKLEELNFQNLITILDEIVKEENELFKVVYEHGDFAEWNILKATNNKILLFDFEYFEENGLEYMDLFKYYFQRATLIEKNSGYALIAYMQSRIDSPSFFKLFNIYLLKEIVTRAVEKMDISKEITLIKQLRNYSHNKR
jgi:hypothetical protein